MLPQVDIIGPVYLSLVVFAVTLTITKAKIFACKRQFVEERYELAKMNGEVSFLHKMWRAWWTCPMCLGFYVAAILCFIFPINNWILDSLAVYGLNWMWHCLEDCLFWTGKANQNGSRTKDG